MNTKAISTNSLTPRHLKEASRSTPWVTVLSDSLFTNSNNQIQARTTTKTTIRDFTDTMTTRTILPAPHHPWEASSSHLMRVPSASLITNSNNQIQARTTTGTTIRDFTDTIATRTVLHVPHHPWEASSSHRMRVPSARLNTNSGTKIQARTTTGTTIRDFTITMATRTTSSSTPWLTVPSDSLNSNSNIKTATVANHTGMLRASNFRKTMIARILEMVSYDKASFLASLAEVKISFNTST
jgi:hypothetical protein